MSAPKSAFPLHPGIQADWDQASGMTLRDWFAGQVAATALYHAISQVDDPQCVMLQDQLPEEWAAKIAFGLADAMLAERSKA